jgi:hypothetical protein
MAAADFVRRARSHTPTDFVDVLRSAVKVARFRALNARASRRTRARLSMLGVPLAIVAALMSGLWWATFPLAACAWWWAPRDWGWEWLDAIGLGAIGTEWAYMGASALEAFPDDRLAVGTVWATLPGALALYAASVKRWHL